MRKPPDVDARYQPGSRYHESRRKYAPAALHCLAVAMEQFGRPASLLDLGCGDGALVTWCRGQGMDACGVDLAIPLDRPVTEGLFAGDLRKPVDLLRPFEWVLCWEVAEHLPETAAATLCDSLVRHVMRPSGRLIFTAAQPGQRGPGHIHCETKAYWQALLMARGLTYLVYQSLVLTRAWRVVAPTAPWYAANVQVFAWA